MNSSALYYIHQNCCAAYYFPAYAYITKQDDHHKMIAFANSGPILLGSSGKMQNGEKQ
jgi:hypothetical protein